MVFIWYLSTYPNVIALVGNTFPWKALSDLLNSLLISYRHDEISLEFPRPEERPTPLPEDFAMRGTIWAEEYFPDDWFSFEGEEDERYFERPSTTYGRKERILYLGGVIAARGRYLAYNDKRFFNVAVEGTDGDSKTPTLI